MTIELPNRKTLERILADLRAEPPSDDRDQAIAKVQQQLNSLRK